MDGVVSQVASVLRSKGVDISEEDDGVVASYGARRAVIRQVSPLRVTVSTSAGSRFYDFSRLGMAAAVSVLYPVVLGGLEV